MMQRALNFLNHVFHRLINYLGKDSELTKFNGGGADLLNIFSIFVPSF